MWHQDIRQACFYFHAPVASTPESRCHSMNENAKTIRIKLSQVYHAYLNANATF
jgi:hypothetical protein